MPALVGGPGTHELWLVQLESELASVAVAWLLLVRHTNLPLLDVHPDRPASSGTRGCYPSRFRVREVLVAILEGQGGQRTRVH